MPISLKEFAQAAVTLVVVIAAVSLIYFIGISVLTNLSVEIDDSQNKNYRKAVVLENLVSVKASENQLENTPETSAYEYDRRRAHIPIEYFSHKKEGSEGIGYKVKNGNCYLEDVSGLDGTKYGFSISHITNPRQKTSNSPKGLSNDCISNGRSSRAVSAPVILIRKDNGNPPLPVKLHVYEVQ